MDLFFRITESFDVFINWKNTFLKLWNHSVIIILDLKWFSWLISYSLKINELIQYSPAGVNFFNLTPAKNTNFWVKLLLCVSSDLSYRYTIETRVLAAHIWFSDEKQNCYTVCLNVFHCLIFSCESVVEWLKHLATISLLELETWVRITIYNPNYFGHGYQAQNSTRPNHTSSKWNKCLISWTWCSQWFIAM